MQLQQNIGALYVINKNKISRLIFEFFKSQKT